MKQIDYNNIIANSDIMSLEELESLETINLYTEDTFNNSLLSKEEFLAKMRNTLDSSILNILSKYDLKYNISKTDKRYIEVYVSRSTKTTSLYRICAIAFLDIPSILCSIDDNDSSSSFFNLLRNKVVDFKTTPLKTVLDSCQEIDYLVKENKVIPTLKRTFLSRNGGYYHEVEHIIKEEK